jgi:hypothetical protein
VLSRGFLLTAELSAFRFVTTFSGYGMGFSVSLTTNDYGAGCAVNHGQLADGASLERTHLTYEIGGACETLGDTMSWMKMG